MTRIDLQPTQAEIERTLAEALAALGVALPEDEEALLEYGSLARMALRMYLIRQHYGDDLPTGQVAAQTLERIVGQFTRHDPLWQQVDVYADAARDQSEPNPSERILSAFTDAALDTLKRSA